MLNKLRCLRSGLLAMGGLTGLNLIMERKSELPGFIHVLDDDGRVTFGFGLMEDFKTDLVTHITSVRL
jgi:hypothetical protein